MSSAGRGTGIIDTIHLVEVFRGARALAGSGALTSGEQKGLRDWVNEYLSWLTTSQYGHDERDTTNNHAACWVMQAAEFAVFTGNVAIQSDLRKRFETVLLPTQMAENGSFRRELNRTKPYSYSLFNLELMSAICQILSTPEDHLWAFHLPDGRCVGKAVASMYPYIADKSKWPYPPDVMLISEN